MFSRGLLNRFCWAELNYAEVITVWGFPNFFLETESPVCSASQIDGYIFPLGQAGLVWRRVLVLIVSVSISHDTVANTSSDSCIQRSSMHWCMHCRNWLNQTFLLLWNPLACCQVSQVADTRLYQRSSWIGWCLSVYMYSFRFYGSLEWQVAVRCP